MEHKRVPEWNRDDCSSKRARVGNNFGSFGSHFKIHPRSKYNSKPPVMKRPTVIGDFSLDGNRQFCPDKRNLNFISVNWHDTQKVDYDLNVALDKVTKKDYKKVAQQKLDPLLKWILINKKKFHAQDSAGKTLQCLPIDFVCFKGMLKELLCTPYENREGWIICATKFRGTIYMSAYETPERKAQRENATEEQQSMCSWGYKFEQYMTDGADTSQGVNENEEYHCVLRSVLAQHSFLYCAELDGADPAKYNDHHTDLSAFVELKTNKAIISDHDHRSFCKYKLIKWWSQSHLVGIDRLICGFRDPKGIVKTLKEFKVEEMPYTAQDHWRSNVMLTFLHQIMTFIKVQVQLDDPEVVYKFERPYEGGDISCEYLGKDPKWTFLPEWYYQKVFDM